MNTLNVGTITYASKGRDILAINGIRATIKRSTNRTANEGCGYSLVISENSAYAVKILNSAGIRVFEVRQS